MQFVELNFDEFDVAFKSLKRNKAAGFDDLGINIIIIAYDRKISCFPIPILCFQYLYSTRNISW